MIELINGVAYLKDIKSPEQSLEMFEYLKRNPVLRLYLIKGVNSYGCGLNGELVKIENMPRESIENGYCINPFYVAEIKPLNEPTIDENIFMTESTKEVGASHVEPIQDVKSEDDCGIKLNKLELALENAIKERDMYVNVCDNLKTDNEYLENRIEQLSNVIECNKKDYQELQHKLASNLNENKVEKSDIRGLCKALCDLGFDVNLQFIDYGVEMDKDFEH